MVVSLLFYSRVRKSGQGEYRQQEAGVTEPQTSLGLPKHWSSRLIGRLWAEAYSWSPGLCVNLGSHRRLSQSQEEASRLPLSQHSSWDKAWKWPWLWSSELAVVSWPTVPYFLVQRSTVLAFKKLNCLWVVGPLLLSTLCRFSCFEINDKGYLGPKLMTALHLMSAGGTYLKKLLSCDSDEKCRHGHMTNMSPFSVGGLSWLVLLTPGLPSA